jgi:hypothetical protein
MTSLLIALDVDRFAEAWVTIAAPLSTYPQRQSRE